MQRPLRRKRKQKFCVAGHKMLSCGGKEATISAMIGVIHGRVSSPQISTITHLLMPKIPPSVIYLLGLKLCLSFEIQKVPY